jgi:adenine-specific DNA-methyltransferase
MYPRLFLAKNLLREDGVIFISIDDNEVHNLRALCNEIFGEENFVSTITWEKRYSPQNAVQWFSEAHDFILVYSRNKEIWQPNLLERTEEMNARYRNLDNDPRGNWKPTDASAQGGHGTDSQFYELTSPNGQKFQPPNGRCWVYTKERIDELIADNRVWFGSDGNSSPAIKRFLTEVKDGVASQTIWKYEDVGHNQEGKKEIKILFPETVPFDTPKPTRLIKRILQLCTNPNDDNLILDFFAGSCTTAHAVMELNKQDGGNRKFICVQIPQPTETDSEAAKAGYKNIADIGKERIRRVSKRITAELQQEKEKQELEAAKAKQIPSLFGEANHVNHVNPTNHSSDIGFKVFKLAPSNFKVWDSNIEKTPEAVQLAMQLHTEHINTLATQEALLYEILLKSGFELATPIEKLTIEGKTVYSVSEGQLLICLEKEITHELIKAIAESQPIRVVCLDEGFRNNDQLKTNAVQIMKSKGVVKFQTV